MGHHSQKWVISSMILLLALSTLYSRASGKTKSKIKSAVFLSPKVEQAPGMSAYKYYYDVEFPRGHIGIKYFKGELVDEEGNPIPLYDTYLHHWLVTKYYQRKNSTDDHIIIGNTAGVCQGGILQVYFGVGSETRRTPTYVPDPYGIEIGNPAKIPAGYEEKWMINIHALDTRGAEDRWGCTECRCHLFNATKDLHGHPLRPDYRGGMSCCHDNNQCRLKEGFKGLKRGIYLKYSVKWVDWDSSVIPVRVYTFDVTDNVKIRKGPKGLNHEIHSCQIEYDVEARSTVHKDVDIKKSLVPMKTGGYVIYAVAHQHAGAVDSTVYGQDGRVICSSFPKYGTGDKAGNEKGHVVAMTTCYPRPGSVKIFDGETLTHESRYNNSKLITGVMGLFYLLLADRVG